MVSISKPCYLKLLILLYLQGIYGLHGNFQKLNLFRNNHKTFLDDGYVSLLSKSNNSKLGTSHRFKPMLIEKPNFNSAHTWQKSQLSLFDGVADGV